MNVPNTLVQATENELESLLDSLGEDKKIIVLPIVNGLEVWVHYKNGKLQEIFKMVNSKKVTLINVDSTEEDKKQEILQDLLNSLGLPKRLYHVKNGDDQNITFRGYMYMSEKPFGEINSARESVQMERYASIMDLCTRLLDNPIAIEEEALENISIILTDFSARWKNSFMSILGGRSEQDLSIMDLFQLDGVPFAPHFSYKNKAELIAAASDENPYQTIKANLMYDIIGINMSAVGFGALDGISVYSHYYKMKPVRAIIDHVEWEMMASGKLVPYAIYYEDGVDKQGNPVKARRKIYLYSPKYIIDNDLQHILRMGDEVFVGRGPNHSRFIYKINYQAREGLDDSFDFFDIPDVCPYCRHPVVDTDESPDGNIYCDNPYCFTRIAVVTTQLVQTILKQDRRYGLIHSVDTMKKRMKSIRVQYSELFDGPENDELDEYPYSIRVPVPKVIAFDHNVKNISLAVFLMGLGIDGLTSDIATDLASRFKNIDELRGAFLADIKKTSGISDYVASNISSTMSDEFYGNIIKAMEPYLEDRTIKPERTKDEEDAKDRYGALRKMLLNKIVEFDGINFNHYRELVEFFKEFGAFIATSYVDPTTGVRESYYSRRESGVMERVDIDMASDKARERIQYIITGDRPSSFVSEMEHRNSGIMETFRDSDNPEKTLAKLVIIMTEEEAMVMVNNYKNPTKH